MAPGSWLLGCTSPNRGPRPFFLLTARCCTGTSSARAALAMCGRGSRPIDPAVVGEPAFAAGQSQGPGTASTASVPCRTAVSTEACRGSEVRGSRGNAHGPWPRPPLAHTSWSQAGYGGCTCTEACAHMCARASIAACPHTMHKHCAMLCVRACIHMRCVHETFS